MKSNNENIHEVSENYLVTKFHRQENIDTHLWSIPIEVHSFTPGFCSLQKDLEIYRDEIVQEGNESLIANYKLKRLNFEEQEVISIFLSQGKIIGFCTAWNRDFYPDGTVRVLNRYWQDQTMRKFYSKACVRTHIQYCVEHQCLLSKRKGFKWAFISKDSKSKRYCERFSKRLNEHTEQNWFLSNKPVLVTPDSSNLSSWQWVIYRALEDTNQNSEKNWGFVN